MAELEPAGQLVMSPATGPRPFPFAVCRPPVLETLSYLEQGVTRGGEGRASEMLYLVS